MNRILSIAALLIALTFGQTKAQEVITVDHFDKVVVSPHVQVTFTKGDKENVTIKSCSVERNKVHVVSSGSTLRIYLEGAKEITKSEKSEDNGRSGKKPIYQGTVLVVDVSYKYLQELSLRGEEKILLKSKIDQQNFDLTVYGEADVQFSEVELQKMHTVIYGESTLDLRAGNIEEQRITSYGESKVNALPVKSKFARLTLYGESEINVSTSDQISVTAFGEAKVNYKGNPQIKKGVTIGGVKIHKID